MVRLFVCIVQASTIALAAVDFHFAGVHLRLPVGSRGAISFLVGHGAESKARFMNCFVSMPTATSIAANDELFGKLPYVLLVNFIRHGSPSSTLVTPEKMVLDGAVAYTCQF